jgi:glutamyl-tRNA synthetase
VAPTAFDPEDKFIRKNWKPETAAEMQQLHDVLATIDDFSVEGQKAVVDPWVEQTGIKPWNAWRICLVGEGQGPDMYALAAFLGKEEVLKRMEVAINKLTD